MGEPHFHNHLVGLVVRPSQDEGKREKSKTPLKTEEPLGKLPWMKMMVVFFNREVYHPLDTKKTKRKKTQKNKNVL